MVPIQLYLLRHCQVHIPRQSAKSEGQRGAWTWSLCRSATGGRQLALHIQGAVWALSSLSRWRWCERSSSVMLQAATRQVTAVCIRPTRALLFGFYLYLHDTSLVQTFKLYPLSSSSLHQPRLHPDDPRQGCPGADPGQLKGKFPVLLAVAGMLLRPSEPP